RRCHGQNKPSKTRGYSPAVTFRCDRSIPWLRWLWRVRGRGDTEVGPSLQSSRCLSSAARGTQHAPTQFLFPGLIVGGAFLRSLANFALEVAADGAQPFETIVGLGGEQFHSSGERSSSGVTSCGVSWPSRALMRRMCGNLLALAMCWQFHVTNISQRWKVASARWSASAEASTGMTLSRW